MTPLADHSRPDLVGNLVGNPSLVSVEGLGGVDLLLTCPFSGISSLVLLGRGGKGCWREWPSPQHYKMQRSVEGCTWGHRGLQREVQRDRGEEGDIEGIKRSIKMCRGTQGKAKRGNRQSQRDIKRYGEGHVVVHRPMERGVEDAERDAEVSPSNHLFNQGIWYFLAYFESLYLFWVDDSLRTLKVHQCLLLPNTHLVGEKMEFDIWDILDVVPISDGW